MTRFGGFVCSMKNKENSTINLCGTFVTIKVPDRPNKRPSSEWAMIFPLHIFCKPQLSLAIGVPFIQHILHCTQSMKSPRELNKAGFSKAERQGIL